MKKVLALLLSVALCGALAACGGDGGQSSSVPSPDAPSSTPAADSSDSGADAADLSKQDPVTLEVYALTFRSEPSPHVQSVQDAVNAYVKPLLNTEIHLNIIPYAAYQQQLTLLISSSEQADLIMGTGGLIPGFANAGGLAALDESIEAYGKDIVDIMGWDVLNSCRFGGDLYAVPTNRDLARSYIYMYNKNLNERFELGLENAKNFDDLDAAFAKLQAADPTITPWYIAANTHLFSTWDWDPLGNNLGVLMNYGDNLEVVNLYATEYYRELCTRMFEFYNKGYINKDATTTTNPSTEIMLAEKALGQLMNYNPADSHFSQLSDLPYGKVELTQPLMTTSSISTAAWMVSRNTVSVDRSMQFMNLMWSDPTVFNLLSYGVEGEDYVVVDEEKGVIDFPEGVTAPTSQYDNQLGWMWGNRFIGYIWNGDNETIWKDLDAFNKSAHVSKASGFTFDSASVQNEITACNNAIDKYAYGLECGAVDPAEMIPAFLKELENNGINTIIEEKQKQLDAWAAANGVN